ncbi:SRPBCC family protein [Natrarchaeobius halalkaliphilus]|uniref:SRPBCC family protein n=1 Tax=Natrarchaeobius halalkaliphilus TaxID=1679091 RepID=A0A3N6M8M5_9EURY|nr:SRPBCC family protein [Natrarchaeobius halalkaliphilus]RQG91731.1 SRPBCC family protein [Natrarchaeobius halalkaliphilus]
MTRIQRTRTQDGRRLEVSHVFEAPPAEVWDLLVDTTRWTEWLPIVGVESTDRRIQAGTSGRIRVPGVWLPFVVTDRADRRWTWRIAGAMGATHRVDDLGAKRCRVAFELPPHAVGSAPLCLDAVERIERLWDAERSETAEAGTD